MSFLYGKKDPLDVLPDQRQDSAVPTLVQNFQAAEQSAYVSNQSVSEGLLLQQQWGPIVEEINARQDGLPFANPADIFTEQALSGLIFPSLNESAYQYDVQEIINHINENPDIYPDLLGITPEGLLENAKATALALRRNYEETADQSPGIVPAVTRFAGEVYGTVTDPVLLYSMAQSRGTTALPGLLGIMFREAAIGAGTEAIIQKEVKDWYEDLGLDYTWEDFATNVAIGGVFGAGAPLVFKIGGDSISLTTEQAKKGYDALVRSGAFTPKGTTKAAERMQQSAEDAANANPLVDEIAHQERLKRASTAVENNTAPAIPDQPPVDIKPPSSVYDADNIDGLIYRFDPAEIQVDAETFQFKAGGDEFGVSERLQGVTEWDPIKAGQITVFEFADGRKFIADGHQRLGLAKRIQAQDPTQDVRLYGQVLREVDGITPEMARVVAAMKNIAEGTGTAIDAAKVLRVAPERAGELPPRSALVRQAQELVMLDDDAFGAVINGLIPANYGAVVGRLIPDNPGLQQNAISILSKTDPANEFQAEAVVRQVREAGFEQREQVGLFGDEMITESFFTERARILDRAQKALRQDKNAFGSLVNNADRLAAEGNILAQNANLRRAENDAQALALLQALANKVGPLSDSLTAAARQARETGSYTEPTRGFVDAIRNAIESGDFERIGAGDVGRPVHDSTQSRVRPDEAEPELEGFDDASGAAASRQADQLESDVLSRIREAIESFDEEAYIRLINPESVRIPDEMRPRLLADDIADILPQNKMTQKNLITTTDNGVSYYKDGNDIYAVISDMEGDRVVGYSVRADEGTDLVVAEEFQGQGIGAELSYLYRSQDPKAYSGGLTAAGEAVARKTYRRLAEIKLQPDPLLYFESTADSIDLPVSQLVPVRARPEGIFNAKVFMAQAAEGTRSKRQPIEVRDNGDGTYTLWDGNSTYSLAVDAGFETVPAKVLSADEFRAAAEVKNAKRVLDPQGKEKRRIVTVQDGEEAVMAQFMTQMKQRQNLQSIDEMLERAEINHTQLNDAAAEIAEELGLEFDRAPLKTRSSVMRKLTEKYQYNPAIHNEADFISNMTDVARSGITILKPENVNEFLKRLNKKYHVIDEGFNFTDAGYFDAKAIVVMPDGQLAEFQFWPPGMFNAKELADLERFGYPDLQGGHNLYEIERDVTLPNNQRKAAKSAMQKLYGEVIDELPASFDSMLLSIGRARKSAPSKTPKDSASALDISGERSSIRMAEGEPGPAQIPAEEFQTNADRLSSEIAASDVPSTLKNLIDDTSELSVDDLTPSINLDEEIPFDLRLDADGEVVSQTTTLRQLKAEIDQDQAMLDRLEGCVP